MLSQRPVCWEALASPESRLGTFVRSREAFLYPDNLHIRVWVAHSKSGFTPQPNVEPRFRRCVKKTIGANDHCGAYSQQLSPLPQRLIACIRCHG